MTDLQVMLWSLFVLIHNWEEMSKSLKKFGVGQPVSETRVSGNFIFPKKEKTGLL